MTAEKFYVTRHPETQRRTNRDLREYDETDFDDIISIVPYRHRRPASADELIKYDHSAVNELFPSKVPDRVLDLVEIAVATFAADKAVKRKIKIRDDFDESRLETRNIKIQIPVLSSQFATDEMERLYSTMVSHITHDTVEYSFHKVDTGNHIETDVGGTGVVSLLSDGLDSTAGIYHNRSRDTDSKYITVNYGGGVNTTVREIARETGIDQHTCRTQYEGEGELTQFSRGLLHLTFGAAAAVAHGADEIRCFENGIMARFLILSEGWITTRTVSPRFLSYFNQVLEITLSQLEVKNPFVDLTKTEIVNKIPETKLVQKTVSCPHKTWFGGGHCGFCVPCLIRNIGIIESDHEIPLEALSKYDTLLSDFENQEFEDKVPENINDSANSTRIFFKGIAEISYFCRRVLTEEPTDLASEYPQLLDKEIYDQHYRFAENMAEALKRVSNQNPTITRLLPDRESNMEKI